MAFQIVVRCALRRSLVDQLCKLSVRTSPLVLTKTEYTQLAFPERAKLTPLGSSPSLISRGAHLISHKLRWKLERILCWTMLGFTPVMMMSYNNILDNLWAAVAICHMTWSMEAFIIDYFRPVIMGHTIPKVAKVILYVGAVTVFGGLLYFNYNDVGISTAINLIWKMGRAKE